MMEWSITLVYECLPAGSSGQVASAATTSQGVRCNQLFLEQVVELVCVKSAHVDGYGAVVLMILTWCQGHVVLGLSSMVFG